MAGDDLNEDESNALLRDLENRARNPSTAAAAADDDEDIEAFLRSLESEDAPARPTKVADKPAPKPVPIKEAPKAEMVAKPEATKAKVAKEPKELKELKEAKEPKTDEKKGGGKKAVVLKFLGKSFLVLTPTLALWWVLGAYLSQWISAWWLVLTIASVVTLSIPIGLKLLSRRGQMGWWFAGTSLALTLLLTLPLPSSAASAIGSYGHWPATSLEASGAVSTGSVVSSVNQWVSLKLAQLLAPGEYAAFRLGTETPLIEPPTETPKVETPPTPEVNPPTTPPTVAPEVTSPEVEIPTAEPAPPTQP